MFTPIQIRGFNNYDADAVSEETAINTQIDLETGEVLPSLTQQQFKEETDINTIVQRFGLTGQLPDDLKLPMSGDFTNVESYEQMQTRIAETMQEFMRIPAQLRERFNNDPGKLISFLDNAENRDEALKLGLIQKPAEPIRTVIDAVDELRNTLTTPKT